MFSSGMFQIDPNSTPDQIAKKRQMIASLMPRFGSARYVGEGIGQALTGFAMGRQNRQLDKIEGDGTAAAKSLRERIFGGAPSGPLSVLGIQPDQGGAAMPAVPANPNSPDAIASDAMSAIGKGGTPDGIRAGLVARGLPEHIADAFMMNFKDESNLNPGINEANPLVPGSRGGFGLAQWTGPRRKALEAFAAEKGMPVSDPNIQLDFLMTELQGPEAAAWNKIGSTSSTGEAAAAIVNDFLRPAEQNRAAREAEYLSAGGGAAPAPTSAPQIPVDGLYSILMDPWQPPEVKAMAQSMIAEQQQASDPLRQQQIEMGAIELDRARNPQQQPPADYTERMFLAREAGLEPGTPEFQSYLLTGDLPASPAASQPAGFVAMDLQAKAAGLQPGTPEYQEFMRNGGTAGAPAAYIALKMQAEGAGLKEGTPEFQKFMLTRGAGSVAEAKALGEASGAATAAAPSDIAIADRTLEYIDEVRNHPGRGAGTGATSVFNVIPGTSGRDFQNRVDQLKSGAFLTAIDDLRGMGALSNAEGQTATAAITRMDTTTSEAEFNAALDDYESTVKLGRNRAQKRVKAPADMAPAEPAATGVPQPGMIEDGYQFKGGDPADPANWVKVQ